MKTRRRKLAPGDNHRRHDYVVIATRMPAESARRVKELASADGRSVASYVAFVLDKVCSLEG